MVGHFAGHGNDRLALESGKVAPAGSLFVGPVTDRCLSGIHQEPGRLSGHDSGRTVFTALGGCPQPRRSLVWLRYLRVDCRQLRIGGWCLVGGRGRSGGVD